jgi:hypothetical protein
VPEVKLDEGRKKERVKSHNRIGIEMNSEDKKTLAAIFPFTDFEVNGASLAKFKLNEGNPRTTNIEDESKRFALQYLKTIDRALAYVPGKWLLLWDGNAPHMPYGCGIPALSYAKMRMENVILHLGPHPQGCGLTSPGS